MITCTFENGNVASPGLRHITVSTVVIKDNQILLGLRGTKNGAPIIESGKWGLLGGYFDRDERLVEAVEREVFEESGWQITDITLLRINDFPGRPMEDRQNVDFIYFARATKQIGKHDEEVKELKWFDLDKLPSREQIAFDHADAIDLAIKHLDNPIQLPILS